jgi:hypothetical protein
MSGLPSKVALPPTLARYLDRALNVKENIKDDNFYPAHAFLTEREAKRNKLLRQLATRTDKWLPKEKEEYYSW